MKNLSLTLIMLLLSPAPALSYEQQKTKTSPLIHGTETAQAQNCPDGTVYTYNTYTIYTVKSPDFEGQNIYVFNTKQGQDPCGLNLNDTYYTIKAGEFGGANEFTGVLGDKLFIDQWTGRDHKRLLIIGLSNKSMIFFDWYDDPRIEDGILYYNKVLKGGKRTKKSIPCPDAEKWESEGLLPIYIQKAQVNLTTMKKSISDTRSCKAVTPIQQAKPTTYRGH